MPSLSMRAPWKFFASSLVRTTPTRLVATTIWHGASEAQGKYSESQPLHEKAMEIRRRLLGEDHPDTAKSYENLGMNLYAQGKYAEAEVLLRKAMSILRRQLGEDHCDTANCYNDLAMILDDQSRNAEAESLLRIALAILRQRLGDNHPDTAACYNNLAYNLERQGRDAEAEPLHRKSLAIRRHALGEDHPETANGYDNLAMNLRSQGKYTEAEPLVRMALAIFRRTVGENHPDTAICYNNLANTLDSQGRHADAWPLHQKVLVIESGILGEDCHEIAISYSGSAFNLVEQGKYPEAEPFFRRSLAILRRVLGEEHPDTAVGYLDLAYFLDLQGRYGEAEPLLHQALATQRRLLGEDHPNTALTYSDLTSNLIGQGKYGEVASTAMAAVKSFENARLRISFSGLDRAVFAVQQSPLPVLAALEARLGLNQDAWDHWEASLARGLFDDVAARRNRPLKVDERRRQDELIAQISRIDNQIATLAMAKEMPQERRQHVNDLKNLRLDLQGRLVQLEAELTQKYKPASGQVFNLEKVQAQLPIDGALVGWLDSKTQPKAADPKGDHWACVVRHTGTPIWLRIAGTGPDKIWTRTDDDRANQVRRLLSGVAKSGWNKQLAELVEQRLAPLEPAFQARGPLPAVKHLIVLPSPAMAGIPVEAILEARPAGSPRYLVSYSPSGTMYTWLQEHRPENPDKSVLPRALLALGDPVPSQPEVPNSPAPVPPNHGLLLRVVQPGSNAATSGMQPGDVLLTYAGNKLSSRDDLLKQVQAMAPKAASVAITVWRDGKTLDLETRPGPLDVQLETKPAAEAILAQREGDTLLRRTRGARFDTLPGSRREVRSIASLFKRSDVLIGSDASEQRLDDLRSHNKLCQFAVIHLATHGKMDDLTPMKSRLLLSQDRLPDPAKELSLDLPVYDGILTAGEVMSTWKLDADLVTLSACQTGLGGQGGGEGFVGFAQAFFLAGARSLLLSLWEVDDRATSLLMVRFYQNWLGKRDGLNAPMPKAEALHEAKEWLRTRTSQQVDAQLKEIGRGEVRIKEGKPVQAHPFEHPHYWAAFILMGDPS